MAGVSGPDIHSLLGQTALTSSTIHIETLRSFLRSLPEIGRKWKPLGFSNSNFSRIPVDQKIEEETFPHYAASQYYPARLGEVIRNRYHIVGKLGFGSSSTVWLARDMK